MQRRVVSRGAIAFACGLWLAGTSTAAAQTASASSPVPPPAQLPRPESSVVEVPELLRFQFVPKFVTGIPVGPFGKKVGASPGAATASVPTGTRSSRQAAPSCTTRRFLCLPLNRTFTHNPG